MTWRWIGESGKSRPLSAGIPFVVASNDPYLREQRDRGETVKQRATRRLEAYQDIRQEWIDRMYPQAAERFRDLKRARHFAHEAREREQRQERRDAKQRDVEACEA